MADIAGQVAQPVIIRSPAAPTVYADGLTQLHLGYPISRVVLHGLVERSEDPPGSKDVRELRHVACELVMPTIGLLDMAVNVLRAVRSGEAQLADFSSQSAARIQEMINSISVSPDSETGKVPGGQAPNAP
jgi:hypothetical protein